MKIKLVTRHCLCACGFSFRVSAHNTINHFYSLPHAYKCHLRDDAVGKLAREWIASVNPRVKYAND